MSTPFLRDRPSIFAHVFLYAPGVPLTNVVFRFSPELWDLLRPKQMYIFYSTSIYYIYIFKRTQISGEKEKRVGRGI